MSTTYLLASAVCNDCHVVVARGIAIIGISDLRSGMAVIRGPVLSKSGDHHIKYRKIQKIHENSNLHNDMTLFSGDTVLGSFTANSIANAVAFTILDKELQFKFNNELLRERQDSELKRRGGRKK